MPTIPKATKQQGTSTGYLYVLWADGTNLYKIGFSRRVGYRLQEIQASSPLPLWLVCCEEGSRKDEERLHDKCAEYHAHGEWYQLPPDAIDELLAWGGWPEVGPHMIYGLLAKGCDCCKTMD